jgi:uncharacterized protein with GYD domain
MPLYMTQFAYTPDAWAALTKKPEDRSETLRNLLERLGGQLHSFYYSFGEYDGVFIFEAPDETVVTSAVMAATAAGHIKAIKTTTLVPMERALAAMRKAGNLTYQPPSGD